MKDWETETFEILLSSFLILIHGIVVVGWQKAKKQKFFLPRPVVLTDVIARLPSLTLISLGNDWKASHSVWVSHSSTISYTPDSELRIRFSLSLSTSFDVHFSSLLGPSSYPLSPNSQKIATVLALKKIRELVIHLYIFTRPSLNFSSTPSRSACYLLKLSSSSKSLLNLPDPN